MFAQLGTTIFDGAKSFVTWEESQEAVVVEFALMGKKADLQGAAIGLRNPTISLYLHQEYCVVKDEISKLRTSMESFEILRLLWGNGTIEGYFVIVSMNIAFIQMDDLGNVYDATVSVALKEKANYDPQNQAQQDAQTAAFATGNKQPATKSNRVNTQSCAKKISSLISLIRSNALVVDSLSRQYVNSGSINQRIAQALNTISASAKSIASAAVDPSSCANGVTDLGSSATTLQADATAMQKDITYNNESNGNQAFITDTDTIKGENDTLQTDVQALVAAANPVLKNSILGK